jgi:hypothetical protein
MKTQFRLERSVSNRKTGSSMYQEVRFNAHQFQYAAGHKNSHDENTIKWNKEMLLVHKEYSRFRKMVTQAKFFFAIDGEMVDYHHEPESQWNGQYSIDFIRIFNERIYTTFQLLDDTYYCLDYKARERFEPLIEFLRQLGKADRTRQ